MFRSALVAIPATTAGQKVPVVFHLHGEENVFSIFRLPKDIFQAMEARVTQDLLEVSSGMTALLLLPMATREAGNNWKGYNDTSKGSSRNVYSEKSKADDVQFILDLITKIGEEIPAADMNNVNIAGKENKKEFF